MSHIAVNASSPPQGVGRPTAPLGARACRQRGCSAGAPRLLIVPGLHDSPAGHWQSWLQALYRHSVRVVQHDWETPDLERWSAEIATTLDRAGPGPWVVAAHSFGVLALVHHLAQRQAPQTRPPGAAGSDIVAALLVAPAEPAKFGVAQALPHVPLAPLTTVVGSQTDPWMRIDSAHRWSRRWGSHFVNLGDAGHVNLESGHGPLPLARRWVLAMTQRLARDRHHAAPIASAARWQFAV